MAETVQQTTLRDENINRAVIGFAEAQYKFKQVCLVQKSSSWKETFFKEGASAITARGSRNIEGVTRLAEFPTIEPEWTETSVRHIKHAGQSTISREDVLTDSIDVMKRTTFRVAEAIAKSVDDAIYAAWIADGDIGTAAVTGGNEWDSATVANQNPIKDLLAGNQNMFENNYEPLAGEWVILSPKDWTNLMQNSKVINNPSFKIADVVANGRVGQIVGLNIIVSNSVPADEALIIIGQVASTWKSAAALTTDVIENKQISFTIRSSEIGITMVTNPKAIYRITNTQA